MSDFQKFLDQALKNVDTDSIEDSPSIDEHDVFEDIRKQIVKIRTASGMTQKELAQKAGLTQANVSKIEKGISRPTLDTLVKLARALGRQLTVRLDAFEGGINYD